MLLGEGAVDAKKTILDHPGYGDMDLDVSMTDATKRINEIIDDADRQAGRIIVNAEVEARQYLASVKHVADRDAAEYARAMAALSEALISQAEALSRESQRLLAMVSLAEETGEFGMSSPEPQSAWPESYSLAPVGGLEPHSMPSRVAPETGEPVNELSDLNDPAEEYSAGSRLLATQMAVAGSTRGDIHDRLVNDFGIDDPKPLLDSILGPG